MQHRLRSVLDEAANAPEYAKFSLLPSRWSMSSIFVPLLRARSWMRFARMS